MWPPRDINGTIIWWSIIEESQCNSFQYLVSVQFIDRYPATKWDIVTLMMVPKITSDLLSNLGNRFKWHFDQNLNISFHENAIENVVWNMSSFCIGPDLLITTTKPHPHCVIWTWNTFDRFVDEARIFRDGGVNNRTVHYNDVIMVEIASQITRVAIVYSIVYSDADQRKHQSSASLAFVRGIHRGPVNSPHKWPVSRKMFPFDDVIMWCPNKRPLAITQIAKTLGSTLIRYFRVRSMSNRSRSGE